MTQSTPPVPPLPPLRGRLLRLASHALGSVPSPDAYSESQHLVVLGVHGFALLCSTARDAAGVRLCIKSNSSQLKDDVSLCLKDRRQGNGDTVHHKGSIFT